MDPTLQLLRDLEDPEKYVRVDNVPIFIPHRRTRLKTDAAGRPVLDGEGKPQAETIEVKESDLPRIAENINANFKESGVPFRITLGHIRQDPAVPETAQPKVVGWGKNARVGTFGPKAKPAVLGTCYYRKDCYREAMEYPYRSAEYYHGAREITGVALLKRDPELDMGVLTYERADGAWLYALENTMPDMTPPAPAAPPAAPPAPAAPDHAAMADEYLRHCMSHPHHGALAAHYAGMAMPAAAPALPSATNGAVPGAEKKEHEPPKKEHEAKDDGDKDDYARRQEMLAYQRDNAALQKRIAELEQDNARRKHREEMLVYERDLDALSDAGWQFDRKAEVAEAETMTVEQRKQQLGRIQRSYARAPIGGDLVPTLSSVGTEGANGTPREKVLDQARLDEAATYMRKNGVTWDEACAKVLGK